MNKTKIIFFLIVAMLFSNCGKESDPVTFGCTNRQATNFDQDADEDDGSCSFSAALFYAKYEYAGAARISKIDLFIDELFVGTITEFYPDGPPDGCRVAGAIRYVFQNAGRVYWKTHVYEESGTYFEDSGSLIPQASANCVEVNVTFN